MGVRSRITGAWASLRGRPQALPAPTGPSAPQAAGQVFQGINDPALYEFIRTGSSGGKVSLDQALGNTTVFRCVDLISSTIGMLPLNVMRRQGDGKLVLAREHPLYRVLSHRPNGWQTPYEFKQLMQFWALLDGNAYARVVRSAGRVIGLIPLHFSRVTVDQDSDLSLVYRVSLANGGYLTLPPSDVLHIRGMSEDGVRGISRVRKAGDTIELALQAIRAADRVFRQGMMVGGNLKHPTRISDTALRRLRESMEERYAGAENAGKWIITEEGMEAKPFASTAVDAQLTEMRAALSDSIAEIFGVPRPLLSKDETSWGSGIEQLAILFVRFSLAHWFRAWEEALARCCIPEAEWGTVYADFDETELLRGSSKDQAEFFARALGSGGHRPWMEVNEVREAIGLGAHADGGGLVAAGETRNEPAPVA